MADKAALQADFVDFKNVKTRSKFQLVFEIEIESAEHALRVLGMPNNAESIPVAIAKLAPEYSAPKEKPKSYAQQAKMLAMDIEFIQFLQTSYAEQFFLCGLQWDDKEAERAADFIRHACGVTTCADLKEGTEPGRKFKQLQAQFLSWKEN